MCGIRVRASRRRRMPGMWGIREWQPEDLLSRGSNRPRTASPPTPLPCGAALTRAGGVALYHGRSTGGGVPARRRCYDGVLGPRLARWQAGRRRGCIPRKPVKSGVGTAPIQARSQFWHSQNWSCGGLFRTCIGSAGWWCLGGQRPCAFLASIATSKTACASPTRNGTSARCFVKLGNAGGDPEGPKHTPPYFRPGRTGRTCLPLGGPFKVLVGISVGTLKVLRPTNAPGQSACAGPCLLE